MMFYLYVCVCVCVCERERENGIIQKMLKFWFFFKIINNNNNNVNYILPIKFDLCTVNLTTNN